ncbi:MULTISPECIES: glyoxalase/bleomycin resistance/extradiol dioxygenase family protein [Brevibacterium]|jgi:PhnB protein|uniref:Glyoxalase/bleomycin resistance/extradiol dioxygenase family protein n=1 Tax=Brevibacterium salitolerans TaxID=1403566 RepID=A0ABP5HXG2_9MICO|nr:glyoxalase/bleomycin resistance/extradiol dioxygenase family protein [Brevibacterium sp.]
MSETLAPYIALPGTAGDAFVHWREVLGGELDMLRYGDGPPMEGMPFTPDPQAVAHAVLTTPAGQIAGGDAMGQDEEYPVRGTAYSLLYTADSPERARAIIEAFVAGGGEVNLPFDRAPWGDWYGQVFDRFGVMWSLSVPA